MTLFNVKVDAKFLEEFDKALRKLGYKTRAVWVREHMRKTIKEAQS